MAIEFEMAGVGTVGGNVDGADRLAGLDNRGQQGPGGFVRVAISAIVIGRLGAAGFRVAGCTCTPYG